MLTILTSTSGLLSLASDTKLVRDRDGLVRAAVPETRSGTVNVKSALPIGRSDFTCMVCVMTTLFSLTPAVMARSAFRAGTISKCELSVSQPSMKTEPSMSELSELSESSKS